MEPTQSSGGSPVGAAYAVVGAGDSETAALQEGGQHPGDMAGGAHRRGSTSEIFRALEQRKMHDRGACLTLVFKCWLYPVDPFGRFHTLWDIFILILVFWSSLFTPYQIAFLPFRENTFSDYFVDLCFYLDITLSFWTGYDNGIMIVTDKWLIARRYLKGWFWIDASATIQWDVLIGWFTDAIPSTILGLLRLIKVARLLRASRLIKRLTQAWTMNTGFVQAFQFFIYVLICAHILACFFWLYPRLINNNIDEAKCYVIPVDTGDPDHMASIGCPLWKDDAGMDCTGDSDKRGVNCPCELLFGKQDDGTDPREKSTGEPLSSLNDELLISERTVDPTDTAVGYYFGGERHCPYTFDGDTEAYCGNFPLSDEKECSWRLTYGLEDVPNNSPSSKYIQALYWALTTMTTIGYGDRGPNTQAETILCMFCEIIGLSVFALLLTQINNLNAVMGRERQIKDDVKNEIVGFMKYNMDGDLAGTLITDVIHYLNFKADSIAGLFFENDDPRFAVLSPELLKTAKVSIFVPPLKRVKFFGYSKEDAEEKARVDQMFRETDVDNGGHLDREEILGLTKRLGIDFSDDQLNTAMREMDPDGGGEVDFTEFEAWWFTKKNGKPRTPTCPMRFIEELAAHMRVNAYSPKDVIQDCGMYGYYMNMVLTGTVKIIERDPNYLQGSRDFDQTIRVISQYDREPFFGLVSVLNTSQRCQLGKTDDWFAEAECFCDIAYIPGEDPILDEAGSTIESNARGFSVGMRTLIHEFWPDEGEKTFYSVARNLYHTIWNDHLEFEPTPDMSDVPKFTNPAERQMQELDARVDTEIASLRREVAATVEGLNSKLDTLLARTAAANGP